MAKEVVNDFEIPSWAGKPTPGLHLDVMKDGKMIQKLMIDEKKYYFFGRNKQACDFQIDHQSCSRVHAVLVWHKHLNRLFLVDLGSTHGTFIGNVRIESNKPQQVFTDSELRFGASTRLYIVRERPQQKTLLNSSLISNTDENHENENLNQTLPQSEAELDNLTEFNTAHNRRIAQIVNITESNLNTIVPTVKRKRKNVIINEEEQVINPEDVDPSVGRFRNLIQTTVVIPNKKRITDAKLNSSGILHPLNSSNSEYITDSNKKSRMDDERTEQNHSFDIAMKLGIKLPDLAPDVYSYSQQNDIQSSIMQRHQHIKAFNTGEIHTTDEQELTSSGSLYEPRKKKYAKEAWPGRKPTLQTVNASAQISDSTFSLY